MFAECPCYKDTTRNKVGPATEEDIQVLTVRDGEGKTLQDARFVEILKSAKSRIKSATDSLRGATSEWNISQYSIEEFNHLLCVSQGRGERPGQETPGDGGGRFRTPVWMIWTCLRAPA